VKTIKLLGKHYPLAIEGTGPIPCLIPGSGTLIKNTISARFKKMFTVYSADLYWHSDFKHPHPAQVTMDQICDDMIAIARQLNIREYILFGHSAFGLVSIEIAKKDPFVSGVILVGSPTASNEEVGIQADNYFKSHADSDRKENDRGRKEYYLKNRKPNDSLLSLEAYTSLSARYWADYSINDTILKKVWHGMRYEAELSEHFFSNILPSCHLLKDIEKVKCPVFLAGGKYDFDCIPLELWKTKEVINIFRKQLKIVEFLNSGHWPHFEETELFDHNVEQWIKHLALQL
jgi:pimeloyl-ACP methyl ester carboxylesterase